MENKRVKMCEVLKVLPPYLDNNEYFNHAFRNLIKECREFVLLQFANPQYQACQLNV